MYCTKGPIWPSLVIRRVRARQRLIASNQAWAQLADLKRRIALKQCEIYDAMELDWKAPKLTDVIEPYLVLLAQKTHRPRRAIDDYRMDSLRGTWNKSVDFAAEPIAVLQLATHPEPSATLDEHGFLHEPLRMYDELANGWTVWTPPALGWWQAVKKAFSRFVQAQRCR